MMQRLPGKDDNVKVWKLHTFIV